MTVKSTELVNGEPATKRLNPIVDNRIAAAVVWLAGVGLTATALLAMLVNVPVWLAVTVAVVAQGILTWSERAVWRGKPTSVGIGALILDVLMNAGGVFAYVRNIGDTPTVTMLMEAFGLTGDVSPIAAMIVSLVIGFLIAAAPEEFWSRKE